MKSIITVDDEFGKEKKVSRLITDENYGRVILIISEDKEQGTFEGIVLSDKITTNLIGQPFSHMTKLYVDFKGTITLSND